MLRCTNCGWFNPDAADVCEMCGESLSSATNVEGPVSSDASPDLQAEPEPVPVPNGMAMSGTVRMDISKPTAKESEPEDYCPMCGYPVRQNYESCPNCGYPLSPSLSAHTVQESEPVTETVIEPSPVSSLMKGTIREIPRELTEESSPQQNAVQEPQPKPITTPEVIQTPLPEISPASSPESFAAPKTKPSPVKGTIREIPGHIAGTRVGEPLKKQIYKETIREIPIEPSGTNEIWTLIPITGQDHTSITLSPGEVVEIHGCKYLVRK